MNSYIEYLHNMKSRFEAIGCWGIAENIGKIIEIELRIENAN